MALKSYALTTVQRLKDFLGLSSTTSTQDDVLERIVNSATEYIENYLRFRVKETTYTQEEYDTDPTDTLILKQRPINSSETFTLQRRNSAVNEDEWETVDSQYYHIDYNSGIIYGVSGFKFSRTRRGYRVTYTAGYDFDNSSTFLSDTEAGDLEWACWILCASAWNNRKGGGGIRSERIGDYSVTYAKSLIENDEVKAILDKYADIDTGGVLTPINT